MSCRSTPGSSALVSHAMLATGLDSHETQVAFHDLRRAGAGVPPPGAADVHRLLTQRARQVQHDESIPAARRESVLDRLSAALDDAAARRLPDGPTFHAWQELLSEAQVRQTRRPPPPYPVGSTAMLTTVNGTVPVAVLGSRYRVCRCCAGTPWVLVQQNRTRQAWKAAVGPDRVHSALPAAPDSASMRDSLAGRRSRHGSACSSCAPSRNSVASSFGRPTI